MRWGQRRRSLSAEEIAANKAAREARERASLTCQICARGILANNGVIAHHGYERPGQYYQTASCMGARELPFEVSRDVLGSLIEQLKVWAKDQDELAASVREERSPASLSYTKRDAPFVHGRYQQATFISFTRAEFDQTKIDHPDAFRHRAHMGFDHFRDNCVRYHESQAAIYKSDLKTQTDRFSAWKRKLTPVFVDGRFTRWASVK